MSKTTLDALIGATAYDARAEKIGKVKQIYIDNDTGEATWAAVSTGLFKSDSLVPLAGASHDADRDVLQVRVDKKQVESAPHRDDDRGISARSEQELLAHYHLAPRQPGRNTAGRQDIRPGEDEPMTYGNRDDASVVRSEEQLRVGTESEEAGTAHLRKYVVEEEQSIRVPTTHEEVRVEREPIRADDTGTAPRIGEEEREVTLHADRVTVDKESVPVERVRLAVDEVADEQTVTDTVRKERVETEGVQDDRRDRS
ncbi:PRC and DUF2382 domain-containing protein [Nocardia thailandica]